MKILALIPARAGSKGIPDKNIKIVDGDPLIHYTIKAALKSKFLNKENIICSTDSKKIADIARDHGARVPFLRPKEYATDEAESISVALHALKWMRKNENKEYTHLLLLQPTSPLRRAEDIDEAIEIMKEKDKDSVVSVTKPFFKPFNLKKINSDGELEDFYDRSYDYSRRQEAPDAYHPNGAIYLTKTEVIFEKKDFYGEKSLPYMMDKISSIDIDEPIDLELANLLLKYYQR